MAEPGGSGAGAGGGGGGGAREDPAVTQASTEVAPTGSMRQPGWREAIVVAGLAGALVLGAAFVTGILPTDVQRVVFHTPLLIGVLVIGTAVLLWRIVVRGGRTSR